MTGKNFVGFDHSAEGNHLFKTFDPIQDQSLPFTFYEATSSEVERACLLANEAFLKLQKLEPTIRAAFLDRIADEIMNCGDNLLDIYCHESGLGKSRAEVERARTVLQLRSFADLVRKGEWVEASIDTAITDRVPPKPDLRKMLIGMGPVVVFGSSNFPLAYSTAGGDTAAAFAAGCPVIVKSHPMHAGTGEMVATAIVKAAIDSGMPNGIFSNLNAQGYEVGKQLVLNPTVKAVGFTGSIAGGRALFDLANSRQEPIPVFAEMGSTNPVVVLQEQLAENLELWTSLYADSIMAGTGQFCTSPGLFFLLRSKETEDFIELLATKLVAKDAAAMLHPDIHRKFETQRMRSLVQAESFAEKGAKELHPNYANQTLMSVTGKQFLENPELHHEVFGPFAIGVICQDRSEMLDCISSLKGQLTGTVLGSKEEFEKEKEIINTLMNRVGRLIFNGVPTGVEVCPSMHHGGPYPASTDSRFTAVGIDSIKRFARPVTFQNCPDNMLPEPLKDHNSLNIDRRINGIWTNSSIIG